MDDRSGGKVKLIGGIAALAAAAILAVAVGMRLGEQDAREAEAGSEAPLVR
jgi:hypothetical protein